MTEPLAKWLQAVESGEANHCESSMASAIFQEAEVKPTNEARASF